jgi:hypothetical protein
MATAACSQACGYGSNSCTMPAHRLAAGTQQTTLAAAVQTLHSSQNARRSSTAPQVHLQYRMLHSQVPRGMHTPHNPSTHAVVCREFDSSSSILAQLGQIGYCCCSHHCGLSNQCAAGMHTCQSQYLPCDACRRRAQAAQAAQDNTKPPQAAQAAQDNTKPPQAAQDNTKGFVAVHGVLAVPRLTATIEHECRK